MMPSEVSLVLATAAAFDRREVGDIDVSAWHAAFAAGGLPDLTVEDARTAIVAHYAKTRQWIMPSDVIGFCKLIRSERLTAAGDIHALVQADPNDARAYRSEFVRLHADVAAGRRDATGQLVDAPRHLEGL